MYTACFQVDKSHIPWKSQDGFQHSDSLGSETQASLCMFAPPTERKCMLPYGSWCHDRSQRHGNGRLGTFVHVSGRCHEEVKVVDIRSAEGASKTHVGIDASAVHQAAGVHRREPGCCGGQRSSWNEVRTGGLGARADSRLQGRQQAREGHRGFARQR